MPKSALHLAPKTFDMESPIRNLDDKQLEETVPDPNSKLTSFCPECNTTNQAVTSRKVTLRDLCVNALTSADKDASDIERLDRFALALLIKKKRHPRLTSDDITLIKKRVSAVYFLPIIYARVVELLDPAAMPKAREDGE